MYAIRVKMPGMKKSKLLAPKGLLTRLRIHAAMFDNKGKADELARHIEEENPGTSCRVAKL